MSIVKMDESIIQKMPKARLLVAIPPERVDVDSGTGRLPQAGDLVLVDQGFTFPDGLGGCLVRCVDDYGFMQYEAEAYNTELEEFKSENLEV